MKAEYRRNLNATYLIIEVDKVYQEDYQMHMMGANHITGLLKVSGRGMNDQSRYHYDISGKVSIKAMYEKAKMGYEDVKELTLQLLQAIKAVQLYLLDESHLLLEPEYIFYAKNQFFFCYIPAESKVLAEEFHRLTEYFINIIDYEDKQGIYLAYELHKLTMMENYSLEQVMEKIDESEIGQGMPVKKKPECKLQSQTQYGEDIDQEEDLELSVNNSDAWEDDFEENSDWITKKEMGMQLLKEAKGRFGPIKDMLRRKKTPIWGDWEDILIEEEDLS